MHQYFKLQWKNRLEVDSDEEEDVMEVNGYDTSGIVADEMSGNDDQLLHN